MPVACQARSRCSYLPASFALVFAVAFIALLSPRAVAQVSSGLQGRVTDSSGAAIPGAHITVQNLNTGAQRITATASNGQYEVLSLPAGDYRLLARKSGRLRCRD